MKRSSASKSDLIPPICHHNSGAAEPWKPFYKSAQLLQPECYHSNHLRLGFFTKEGKGAPPRSREGKWKGDFWRVWGLTVFFPSVCVGPQSVHKSGEHRELQPDFPRNITPWHTDKMIKFAHCVGGTLKVTRNWVKTVLHFVYII